MDICIFNITNINEIIGIIIAVIIIVNIMFLILVMIDIKFKNLGLVVNKQKTKKLSQKIKFKDKIRK